jgi:hypothetical protein
MLICQNNARRPPTFKLDALALNLCAHALFSGWSRMACARAPGKKAGEVTDFNSRWQTLAATCKHKLRLVAPFHSASVHAAARLLYVYHPLGGHSLSAFGLAKTSLQLLDTPG